MSFIKIALSFLFYQKIQNHMSTLCQCPLQYYDQASSEGKENDKQQLWHLVGVLRQASPPVAASVKKQYTSSDDVAKSSALEYISEGLTVQAYVGLLKSPIVFNETYSQVSMPRIELLLIYYYQFSKCLTEKTQGLKIPLEVRLDLHIYCMFHICYM